jgi:hypothetical protein
MERFAARRHEHAVSGCWPTCGDESARRRHFAVCRLPSQVEPSLKPNGRTCGNCRSNTTGLDRCSSPPGRSTPSKSANRSRATVDDRNRASEIVPTSESAYCYSCSNLAMDEAPDALGRQRCGTTGTEISLRRRNSIPLSRVPQGESRSRDGSPRDRTNRRWLRLAACYGREKNHGYRDFMSLGQFLHGRCGKGSRSVPCHLPNGHEALGRRQFGYGRRGSGCCQRRRPKCSPDGLQIIAPERNGSSFFGPMLVALGCVAIVLARSVTSGVQAEAQQ